MDNLLALKVLPEEDNFFCLCVCRWKQLLRLQLCGMLQQADVIDEGNREAKGEGSHVPWFWCARKTGAANGTERSATTRRPASDSLVGMDGLVVQL